MKLLFTLPVILVGMQALVFADTVMPGSEIQVRADTPFTVSMWDRGRVYTGYVARDVYGRDGEITIPRGSPAEFTVRQISPDQVALDVQDVTVNGNRYVVDSTGPLFTVPRDGYDNSSGLVRTMMDSLAAAEGSNVDVVARGNEVRVTGGAVVRFSLARPVRIATFNDPGYTDSGYYYHLERNPYR
jgi:hypothetical protein